jgi:hypothetical protein
LGFRVRIEQVTLYSSLNQTNNELGLRREIGKLQLLPIDIYK